MCWVNNNESIWTQIGRRNTKRQNDADGSRASSVFAIHLAKTLINTYVNENQILKNRSPKSVFNERTYYVQGIQVNIKF